MKDTNNQGKSLKERLAEAEERLKNETISDIIAAKRREADSIEASARGSFKAGKGWDEIPFTESDLESALDLAETKRKEDDRLEAALGRELSKNVSKNGADFGQLGDAAKLREAVKCLMDNLNIHLMMPSEQITINRAELEAMVKDCSEALADLPRNCDAHTTDHDWKDICAKCKDGDIEPKHCEYYGEPNGCNSPIYGEHPAAEKSSAVGNCAKLREALATIRKRLVAAYESEANFMRYSPNKPLVDLIDAALAAPPRNCDVGTAREQEKRHKEEVCPKSACPKYEGFVCNACKGCFAMWSQMPYKKEGEK